MDADADELLDNDDAEDEWLSTRVAAALAGVHRNTLVKAARDGRVRATVTREDGNGTFRLYHRGDVEALSGRRSAPVVLGRTECVYVIVLDPETRPQRVKVGCTSDLGGRLATFRTVCPEARILESYPVPVSCEGYVLALAQVLSDNSFSEVFDFTPSGLSTYLAHLSHALAPIAEGDGG